ncbi:hypothetical protein CERZMDRAFT_89751 [Cercospora zeae-maydis SCOH1-5]|uniref:Uncharacterized protein n=1 Tax=Cercospora zeae-maydis SCOH1-5 TaxID=717836 RepID=A0A6A6FU75_9PEZI|nr:hypothetical protein CERZMDRAFT_89751 [Cercospora zeae-maydis SCOH1-5]
MGDDAGKSPDKGLPKDQDSATIYSTTTAETPSTTNTTQFRKPAKPVKSLPKSRDPALTDLALIRKWERAQEWRCDPDPAYAQSIEDYSAEANAKNPVVLLHQFAKSANRSKYRNRWANKRWHAPF